MRNNIQRMINAVSPIFSVILALAIVSSTVGTIILLSVPYSEKQRAMTAQEEVAAQFDSMLDALDDLSESGDTTSVPITTSEGSIESKSHERSKPVDQEDQNDATVEGDRTIVEYSLEAGYNFTVSDLDDTDNKFDITMEEGDLTEARVYWIDDDVSRPLLYYYPKYYNFSVINKGVTRSTKFGIWNGGVGRIVYSLHEDPDWLGCEWLQFSPKEGDSTGEHDTITVTVDTSSLNVGESYNYSVNITSNGANSNGNELAGGNGTFTVYLKIVQDNEPPTLSDDQTDSSGTTGEDVTFKVDATDNVGVAHVYVYWRKVGEAAYTTQEMSLDSGITYSWVKTVDLDDDSDIEYYFEAEDAAENTGFMYSADSPAIINISYNDPPEITDNTVGPAYTGDGFTFNATVIDNIDVPSVFVEYWYGSGGHTNVSMIATGVGDFFERTITVADTVDVLYYIISANDTVPSWNDTGTLNVGNVVDNDAPSIDDCSGSVEVEINGNVTLWVEATDNIGVRNANVSIDGVTYEMEFNGSMSRWEYNHNDDGSDPFYRVFVYDDAENEASSGPYIITQKDDTEPPTLSDDQTDSSGTTGEDVTFKVDATDNVGVAHVYVYWRKVGEAAYTTQEMSLDSGITYSWVKTVDLDDDSDIEYYFEAEDAAVPPNKGYMFSASSPAIIVITDNDPPTIIGDSGDVSVCGEGGTVTLWVTAKDNIGVTSAEVSIDGGAGIPMVYNAGLSRWESTFTNEYTDDDHTYELSVFDAEGLLDSSGPYDITTNKPPVVTIPDQTINAGETFEDIYLDNHVSDLDNSPEELKWEIYGNEELGVEIDEENRVVSITIPDLINDEQSELAKEKLREARDEGKTDVLDQSNTDGSGDGLLTTSYLGQTFTAGFTSELTRVELSLSRYSVPIDITVQIRVDPSEGDDVLAETTIHGFSSPASPNFGWKTADFSDNPPVVEEGETYFIVVLPVAITGEGDYKWQSSSGDRYEDGEMLVSNTGDVWMGMLSEDFLFKTYVDTGAWTGSEMITFRATDPCNASGYDNPIFRVNAPPIVSDIPDEYITSDETIFILLDDYVTDKDDDKEEINWDFSGNEIFEVEIDNYRVAWIKAPLFAVKGYSETITFRATDPYGASDSDDATFTIGDDQPHLAYDPNNLFLECIQGETIFLVDFFYIWNSGVGTLSFKLSVVGERPSWLVGYFPNSGTSTGSDDQVQITVVVNTLGQPIGTQSCTIFINAGTEMGTVTVYLTILPPASPKLDYSPRTFISTDMGGECDELSGIQDGNVVELTLEIWNSGDPGTTLNYDLSFDSWAIWAPGPGGGWSPFIPPDDMKWCSFGQYSQSLSAAQDAYIHEGEMINHGDESWLRVDPKINAGDRTLVQMDIPSLPSDVDVLSSILKLYYHDWDNHNPANRPVVGTKHECWELDEPWSEYVADWVFAYDTGSSWKMWDTAGGTVRSKIDTTTIPDNPDAWIEWDVTESVEAFVEGTRENYGWLIGDKNEFSILSYRVKYCSSEYGISSRRPKLEVDYLLNSIDDGSHNYGAPHDEITIRVDATGLGAGNRYACHIIIESNGGYAVVPVQFEVWEWVPHCFLADTKIAMADGSYKNIEDIKIGDQVQSYDEQTKEIVSGRVAKVFQHTPGEMTDYYQVNDHYLVINGALRVTSNHLMYSNGKWVAAGDLKIGASLFSSEQNMHYRINSIEKIYEEEPVFDLGIERYHTYFVSIADGVDVLAHNDDYEHVPDGVYYQETIEPIEEQQNTYKVESKQAGWPFTGTLCIYLYDDNVLFGKIWVFDSDSLTYSISSNMENRGVTMSNGGVIYADFSSGSGYIKRAPNVDEKDGTLAIRIVQTIVSSPFSASGTGGYKLRIDANLYAGRVRETRPVYNLRLQFLGDNDDIWLKYFKDTYAFRISEENTLFYGPSDEGVRLALSHETYRLTRIS